MMTAAERQTLRVELTDWSDKVWWSEFQDFKVADEKDKYKLKKLGKQEGNAGTVSYTHLTLPTNREV